MQRSNTWQALGLAAVLAVLFAGCPQADNQPPTESGGAQPSASGVQPGEEQPTAKPAEKAEPEPPPPLTVPEVHMTETLSATCLVSVGDEMPGGELNDLEGNKKSLADLRGKKLTVILFWHAGDELFSQMAATAALQDLQKDVAEPYGEKGVAVVAIDVKDPVDVARQHVNEAGATFTNLSDPDGELFAKVATEKLPRVYLLNSEGKIIWFDLEFSQITRQNLLQAIQVELGET